MIEAERQESPDNWKIAEINAQIPPNDALYHPNAKTGQLDDGLYQPMESDERTRLFQSPYESPSYPTTIIKKAVVTNTPQVPIHSDTYGLLPQITDQQVTTTLDPVRETQISMPTQPVSFPTASQQMASPHETTIMSPVSSQTTRPDHSSLYATTSVMLVTFFMAICIIFWLHKQKKRKQEILLGFNPDSKSKLDHSPTNVDRLKNAFSSVKRRSSTSFDTINRMVKRCKGGPIAYSFNTMSSTASAKGARVMEHCHVDLHFESLKRQISPILLKGMAFYDTISDKFKRSDDDNESIRSYSSESHYSEMGSTTTYDSLERCPSQSASSTNSTHTVYSPYQQVRSPSPVVLTAEQLSIHRIKLRDVSSGRGKRECSSVTDATSCTVSRASTNSTRSGKQQGNINCAQSTLPALKSVELFRRNVHRVDMDFQPRKDSQVSLREGQHVVLTRVFEDGWVFCQVVGSKLEGLAPRANLSAWPVRREITPPSPALLECFRDNNSPPTTPISMLVSRFYGNGSELSVENVS